MNRLSFSILKSNRLFSLSLLSIYVMVTVILVLLSFFYPSVQAGLDSFLEEYGLPDATVVTAATVADTAATLAELEGVEAADPVLAVEGKTTLENGEVLTLRYSTIPQSGRCAYYNTVTKEKVTVEENSVLISSKFAEQNGVCAGDALRLFVNGEECALTVTDVVSCPDTIYVARDVNSWFDDTQYGFVYVSESVMESCFHGGGAANLFYLWFEKDADGDATLSAVTKRLAALGVSVGSATVAEDSTVYYQIHSSLDGTKAVITYLPVLIFLMGVLFCGFFVYQVICASRKTIGILQAMGMSTGRICRVFMRYSTFLCTVALLLGFALGLPLLSVLLNIYKETFCLPRIVWRCHIVMLPLVVLAVYAISALSCVLCTGAISHNDPAALFAGVSQKQASHTPPTLRKLRLGAYAKITVASLLRNKKRLAVMTLCNIACLLLTFLSFSVLSSKMTGMSFMFRERFAYDYIVMAEDAETAAQVAALSAVEHSEATAATVFRYEGEYMRVEALSEQPTLTAVVAPDGTALSIPQDGIVLEEGFARRHHLAVGDTVTVGDVSLSVTAISREYFYSAQYVSFETAKRLGVTSQNVVCVRLKAGEEAAFKARLNKMDGVSCFYSMAARRASAVRSMRAMDAPCYVFVALGILIGLVIVSNVNIHSIHQRKKEFATLTVLGSSDKEFHKMFLFDTAVQYVLALTPGLLLAWPLSMWILRKMSSMSMEFVPVHTGLVAVAAATAVLLYLLLSLISARKTVKRLDLVDILARR